MRYTMFATVLFGAFMVVISATAPANAAMRRCPYGGYCPPGTCVKFNPSGHRLQHACNVKNCSAANCGH